MQLSRVILLVCACVLTTAWQAEAQRSVTLAWDPSPSAVAGYEVSFGTSSGNYTSTVNVGNVTLYTVPNLSESLAYYFAVRAYASTGVRSVYSSEVRLDPLGPLTLNRSILRFGAVLGSSRTTRPQTVMVTQRGAAATWQVSSNRSWMQVSPTSGSGSGAFSVRLTPGYPFSSTGTLTGTVTVSMPSNPGATQTLQVAVRIVSGTSAPFGAVDTPANGATNIAGAIAVTGWALDDIEVDRVEVWRAPVPGEGSAQIFLGNAAFVADARSDIEAAHASSPLAYRAGWGYMLLTNMLPDRVNNMPAGGNGTFTLYIYGIDVEGRRTLLGSRVFTANNAASVRPFGTIDTPPQGGVVSGTIMNFGWALSRGGEIPENGSTITVYIDGASVGHPVFGQFRSDIATLFPGYSNSSSAIGYFELDTTTLSNGVHTIAWSVTDVQGRTEGIGSRYFTVANGGAAAVMGAMGAQTTDAAPVTATPTDAAAVAAAPVSSAPAVVASGFASEARMVYPERTTSAVRVSAPMLEPVRVELGADPGVAYEGFLRVNGDLRALPIGSNLDAERGVFTWQPGPAFSGTYELVFVRTFPGGHKERVPVFVTLRAREGHERPTPRQY